MVELYPEILNSPQNSPILANKVDFSTFFLLLLITLVALGLVSHNGQK
jgi:hypothetical protein